MKPYVVAVAFAAALCAVPAIRSIADPHPQLERGKQVYAQFCTQCHGVDGKRGEGYQTPIWGEGSLLAAKFVNAQNLNEYMQIMPINDPNLINYTQRLDVTAYVLANHGALAKDAPLQVQTAGQITIK